MKLFITLLIVSTTVFALDIGDTDIKARTINFLIFAGALYYLIGGKIKALFINRSSLIQADLEQAQDRLQESKIVVKDTEKKLDEAKNIAADFLATSKKEAALLSEKIEMKTVQDLELMQIQQNNLFFFERRNMLTAVVKEVMNDIFSNENIPLDNDTITNILLKKVA